MLRLVRNKLPRTIKKKRTRKKEKAQSSPSEHHGSMSNVQFFGLLLAINGEVDNELSEGLLGCSRTWLSSTITLLIGDVEL
jgi:hypothetical protein